MSIAVSIVEDDAGLRSSLTQLVGNSPGFRCVSNHSDAESALREIPRLNPNVVLMDVNLPGMSGIECVRRLKAQIPGTQIIMLTVYNETEMIFEALTAGATGYLLKQSRSNDLLEAIRDVHEGNSPINSTIARKIVQSFQRAPAPGDPSTVLSPREREVLNLLAKGFLYKEISVQMDISFSTVRTHVRHIYEKLHVRTRTEAVAKHLQVARPAAV